MLYLYVNVWLFAWRFNVVSDYNTTDSVLYFLVYFVITNYGVFVLELVKLIKNNINKYPMSNTQVVSGLDYIII